MTIDQFLSLRRNNQISLGLGLIFFSYSAITLLTAVLSVQKAFTGLVLIGCMF